jgi:hypothetical protein
MNYHVFRYAYVDGGNNKSGGSVLLGGKPTAQQIARLEATLEDESFIAHQVGVPEVFLWGADADYDPDDESTHPKDLGPGKYVIAEDLDHSWHRFYDIAPAKPWNMDEPKDIRSWEDFVSAFEKASAEGWQQFEPGEERPAVFMT